MTGDESISVNELKKELEKIKDLDGEFMIRTEPAVEEESDEKR